MAVPVTRFAWLGMSGMLQAGGSSSTVPSRNLISVFDGLFVVHYVIESQDLAVRRPLYRRSLLPLDFRPPARRGPRRRPPEAPSAPARRARPRRLRDLIASITMPSRPTRGTRWHPAWRCESLSVSIDPATRRPAGPLPLVRWALLTSLLVAEFFALSLRY